MQQKGQLVAVQWTDKWQVHIWSTNADPKRVAVQWISKNGMIEVQIPASVIKYNSAVFGVDLNDQNRSYYPIGRPGTKWWRYLFNYLVQVSMINSFILMKPARPNEGRAAVSQNHLLFQLHLVKALIKEDATALQRAPDTPTVRNPYSPNHTLSKMSVRKQRCFQCSKDGMKMASGRTRETTTGCHLCNIHLHGGEYYSKYHENIKS